MGSMAVPGCPGPCVEHLCVFVLLPFWGPWGSLGDLGVASGVPFGALGVPRGSFFCALGVPLGVTRHIPFGTGGRLGSRVGQG